MYEVKDRVPNFDLNPFIEIKDTISYGGSATIVSELKKQFDPNKKMVVTFDYYHGVDEKKLYDEIISQLDADLLIDTNEIKYPEEIISKKFHQFITDDRVNGVLCTCKIEEFFDEELIKEANEKIANANGLVVVYGVAASVVNKGDVLVYCNLEIQEVKRRYGKGLDNWGAKNYDEEFLRKEKRYTFLEGRIQEWHKRPLLECLDYMIDCNNPEYPIMISGDTFRHVMDEFVNRPFKCVPFFNPGIWGGHWIKKVIGAGQDLPNTAWGITGIIDVQGVQAKCGDNIVKFQGKDIELYKPIDLLGGQVFYLFGYRCPVTMDFLDTWGGGNLSLQCHPTVAYNQEVFNCPTGHYESYYMLDTTENSGVYLGTKDGVKVKDLVEAFKEAQITGEFDDEKWINKLPMKKHDHIFIPSGTIHASAKDTLVLEINTVWLTTFKLWDWGRIDFDGKPRPIDIGHGEKNIQERYQTTFVKDKLVSKRREVDRGDGWRKEHSGTMEYEPLHVDRYWFTKAVHFETNDTVKVMCLVEGEEAIIMSPNDAFEPFVIHYAEAVFIPAKVGQFYVKPYGKSEGKELAILECYQDLGSRY